jgi:drug/metabolite transporter (DMT)-like permease
MTGKQSANQEIIEFVMTPKPVKVDIKAIVILIILCASWGLQQISIKIAVQSIAPALQGGIRSIGATIFLYLWMVARREKMVRNDGTFWWGMGVGLFFSIEFLLIYWGLEFTNASRSVIFLYTMPFFTALGAHWFLPGEYLGKTQFAGLCCAFLGIVTAFSESIGKPQSLMFIGDTMLLLAAVFWAAATVIVKASPLSRIRASSVLLYQLVVSAVLLPLGAILLDQTDITKTTPLILGCIAYQVIWVAFITYLAWFWLIRNYPASKLSAFLFLTPLFGVLEGIILLDEQITYRLLTALAMVCVGIYVVNRTQGSRQSEPTTLPVGRD